MDLKDCHDGIVIVSGDGLVYEVNGIIYFNTGHSIMIIRGGSTLIFGGGG